jgi:hypothetical protein
MGTVNQQGQIVRSKPGVPSIDTRLIADYLMASEADLIPYDELSKLIGKNVQGDGYGYLLAARRIVLREKSFVYRPVKNLGLKRLTNLETAKLMDRFDHVRRTHKTAVKELKTVDLSALPEPERTSAIAKMALAALTIRTHEPKQMKAIEAKVNPEKQAMLAIATTLDAIKKELAKESDSGVARPGTLAHGDDQS